MTRDPGGLYRGHHELFRRVFRLSRIHIRQADQKAYFTNGLGCGKGQNYGALIDPQHTVICSIWALNRDPFLLNPFSGNPDKRNGNSRALHEDGGLMDQWNRRNPEQEVHPGDRFAEVSGWGLGLGLRL